MNKYVVVMQNNIKKSSSSIFTFFFKVFTGFMIGLTMALAGQEFFQFGNFLFVFVIVMSISVFLAIARSWSFWMTLIFNLVCFLIGLLLRMYALMAPGA